jgi:putative transcriptional regulator
MQDVIYIRSRVGIVSRETFLRYLNNEKIFVYEFNGMFYVKINGKKLKKLRERKGLRIHELARLVGISAKTIREYEEGNMDMTIEKASRFFDVLGKDFEDVIEEIDISSFRIVGKSRKEYVRTKSMVKRVTRDERLKIAEKFKELGLDASLYDAIPSDVVLVNRSEEGKKFFISYISKNILMNEAEIKCRENFSFAKALGAVSVIVVDDEVPRDFLIEVEKYGVTSRLTELNSLVKEIVSELRR